MSSQAARKSVCSPGGCVYTLVRTRRRTVAIHIRPDGAAEVRAPLRLAKGEIDRFVDQKAQWIARHSAAAVQAAARKSAFSLEPGCGLLYKGCVYPSVLRPSHTGEAAFDGTRFLLPSPHTDANRPALVELYKRLAREDLQARTARFARALGLAPRSVKVTSARTRWGSCSGKNALCFAWRLILTPEACLDYVVVHELCHMKEHNHSPAFWRQVEQVLPDYAERRQLLAVYGRQLALQDWEGGSREDAP